MALRYPPFLASSMMIAASRNAPPLRWGARGTAVRLLQGGLIQLGFPLPYSTLAQGVPDGIFGDETARGVTKFQEKHKASLKVDQTQDGYNEEAESRNWYYAIGGYHVWGRGVATVTERSGDRECDLDFEYKFFDRYNWDNGKSVTIANITITDKFMGEFHRQGLAQEFDCVGSFRRRFIWKAGTPIPQGQLHTPGGRA